jgi:hypothetical protein
MIMLLSTTQFLSDAEHNVDRYDETENLAQYDETGKIYSFTTKDYTNNSMFQTALKRGTLFGRICLWPKGLIKEFIRKYLDLNRTIFQFYL